MNQRFSHASVIGDELAVAFAGGDELYLPLPMLRRACPCAACQGEPDALGRVARPKVEWTEKSFSLVGIQPVGGYALQLSWEDGHATGLYSFDYLRKLTALA